MRFSDGVNRYHEEKKNSILRSVIASAENLPHSEAEDREETIMMTTNEMTTNAKIRSKKSGIIAAACALLVLGGGITFFASKNDKKNEIKTAPMAAPASEADSKYAGDADDSSRGGMGGSGTGGEVVEIGVVGYLTTSPAVVIEPDDKGTIEDGFEGYNIEVKYLLKDLWKGIDGYAQHSYGMVIDVTAKDGYELPWADEEQKVYSHFGDLSLNDDHSEFFRLMDTDGVLCYGYKTRNEEGEDVLRYVLAADVSDGFSLDHDQEIMFGISGIYWGNGENDKSEGKFIATETFEDLRTVDTALEIPYQIETENDIEETDSETSASEDSEAEAVVTAVSEAEEPNEGSQSGDNGSDAYTEDDGVKLVANDKGTVAEGFEGLDMEISSLWYVPGENRYGVIISIRSHDGSPLDWTPDDHPYLIYGDLEPYMSETSAEYVDMSFGYINDDDPDTMHFLLSTTPTTAGAALDENTVIPFSVVGIAIDGKEVAKGNFKANIQYDFRKEIR